MPDPIIVLNFISQNSLKKKNNFSYYKAYSQFKIA